MRKIILLICIITINLNTLLSQCSSLFSFAAYFETVTFINQSTISNAYYFWNFGDGTSSFLKNPTHKFPSTGNYFVTLFAKDTVTNCSSYYEYWLNVTKYSSDICVPSIGDSLFSFGGDDYIKIIDNSSNCGAYMPSLDFGGYQNFPTNSSFNLSGWHNGRFIARNQFYDMTYINPIEIYKSELYKYNSSKNYTNCSANFEFSIVSQDTTGQRILFKAMNQNAVNYEWTITGFGNPIHTNNDTISHFYPFNSNDLWVVGLKTIGQSNCKDTLWQQILVRAGVNTFVGVNELENNSSIKIYPNPTTSIINIVDESNQLQNSTIQIQNYLGQIVFSSPFSPQIDMRNLSAGIYFLTIEEKGIKRSVKIIKE